MALAWLAAGWGEARAIIVDHGLRGGSAEEAALTAARLAERGIPARVLRLTGLQPGPGIPARARRARYAALEAACREEGFVHLLLGHQVSDQAETWAMRRGRGSGPAGLACMAGVMETAALRRVRPLLGVSAARLRATLTAVGLLWAEDPTNQDVRFLRPRLRASLDRAEIIWSSADAAWRAGTERGCVEAEIAAILAERVAFRPEGFARLSPGPIAPPALAALLQAVTGAEYPPDPTAIRALALAPRPATLAGARLMPAGRLGAGLLVLREAAALAGPVAACDGALWDRRFRLDTRAALPRGTSIGALGADAAGFRDWSRLPAAVLVTMPALRRAGAVIAVPQLEHGACEGLRITFSPARPAAGAVFLPAAPNLSGAGDAKHP